MAALSLKISIPEKNVVKTMQFDPAMLVFQACKIIREKMAETQLGPEKDYGVFLADDDPFKGCWLEPGRTLEYYLLRNGDVLEYKKKMRPLRIRMLDGAVKTVIVDDSQPVANLMVVICTKIGITNSDEYSLVRELPDENDSSQYKTGTLTLKRKDKDKTLDPKMEDLKRKLRTDDDMNWVDHSKTLREQGIDETETLLLRRKFFFSDQNIDSRDPVQLNLLYAQTRDAIINGTHPVTLEEAAKFAGIQCQVQFGDHSEHKHKPGFLDLKEFLPADYAKMKGVEKRVFAEHRRHVGLMEIEAKVKYVQEARSLKTYGVTFFLVKEKMKGKNKLIPRLLGVTKDSVLRLDEKTKEILKQWPLTTVKRWAASPNSFTLDFGDYSDSYYSVQTTEGEQISQLIAGYIDIILKRKKAKDHFGIEGDEGSTMVEDSVAPHRATLLQHLPAQKPVQVNVDNIAMPAVMRVATNGTSDFKKGAIPDTSMRSEVKGQVHLGHTIGVRTQHPQVHSVLTEPQKALLSTISTGQDRIETAKRELDTRPPPIIAEPEFKQRQLELKRARVVPSVSDMNAATAHIISLTSVPEEEQDHPAIGAAVETVSSRLPHVAKDVKEIAALMEDEDRGNKLLDAARNLCNAFSDLLKAAEPGARVPRQGLINAASRVGEATTSLLRNIDEDGVEFDKETGDILLSLAKAVANAAASLVLKAKDVAAKCPDQEAQTRVINWATQCALATSQMVACAKVVAPTIEDEKCQSQLIDACRQVAKAVEGIVACCQQTVKDDHLIGNLKDAAAAVTSALNDLLNHIRSLGPKKAKAVEEGPVETILETTERLFESSGDANEMFRHAKLLAKATAQLIYDIKGQAEAQPDYEMRKKLLAAAKVLADATSRLVKAAKGYTTNPNDTQNQAALKRAAQDLRSATSTAAGNQITRKVFQKLESSAKHATTMATQNIAAAQGVAPYNKSEVLQEELTEACREVQAVIPKVVSAVKGTQTDPESAPKQLHLISCCETFIQTSTKMVSVSRAVVPKVSDDASANQLSHASQQMFEAITDLRGSTSRAQEMTGAQPLSEIDAAIEVVKGLDTELGTCKRDAHLGQLRPMPGETSESAGNALQAACKVVGSAMAQLLTAASQGNEQQTGSAARDTSLALRSFTNGVKSVAATSGDPSVQIRMVDNAKDVLEKSITLFEETKYALRSSTDRERQARLTQVAKSVSNSLNNCVNCLPGQRDIDDVLRKVTDISQSINAMDIPSTNKSLTELQSSITSAAAKLIEATSEVVASTGDPKRLAIASRKFLNAFSNFTNCGMDVAGATSDHDLRNQMLAALKGVAVAASKLLVAATSGKPSVAEDAKLVSERISAVLSALQASNRGMQACVSAAAAVDGIIADLNTIIMFAEAGTLNPENEADAYADHRENILKTAKALVEDTKTLVAGAASSQEQLAVAAQNAVTTMAQLAEVVKLRATALGSNNSEAQISLLNAVKDVASALGELIHATKAASGKNVNDAAMVYLKEAARVMVTNVTSLLKTEITVEDEQQRGTRALESTIEAIAQELRAFDSSDVPNRRASPEELVRVTKPVTLATAKAVAAGNTGKQDDVIVAANMGRKAIFDLLTTCKAAAYGAETHDLRRKCMEAGRNCAVNYREMLQIVHQILQRAPNSSELKQRLVMMSRTIASSVTEVVSAAEALKGSDWVDPEDPTVIAETELLGAASSIEAAAKKLEALRPRRTSIKLPHEDMNFDEMILEAAKSITAATAALIRAASAAQRELVATGRVDPQPTYGSEDGEWSEGLISAARLVAAATLSLVEAANDLVQGKSSEEKLISAAKQVASSTAHLLVACRVKADPNSKAMMRLQAAGNAVKKATDNLVRAAQQVIEHEEEQSITIGSRRVEKIAVEISAREEILRKERELHEAREKLNAIRRAKYGNKPHPEVYGYGGPS